MQAEATAPAPPRAASGARLRAFAGRWEALLLGLIVLTAIIGQGISSEFLTTDSFTTGSLDFSEVDRKSTRLNSSHTEQSRMPSSA